MTEEEEGPGSPPPLKGGDRSRPDDGDRRGSRPARSGGRRPRGPRRDRGDRREPQRVGGLLQALFEKWGIADQVARSRAAGRWEEVVGPGVAQRTGDVRVSGRTLFVEVESAAWLSELNMMRHRYLEALNEGLEEGRKIEKIVFVQGGGRGE